jgi:hypothetical protein
MKVLTFDSSSTRDRDRYKWLYIAFNMGAGAALEQGDKGHAVARVNGAILDKLDAISEPIEQIDNERNAWPGFSVEEAGFVARELHEGPVTLELKESELNRIKAAANAAMLRFTPIVHKRHGLDLFEFLEGAKDQDEVKNAGADASADRETAAAAAE